MNQIQCVSKMFDCHDAAKSVFGGNFEQRIAPYQTAIMKQMQQDGTDNPLSSTIRLAEKIQEKDPHGSGMAVMLIFAAYIEMTTDHKTSVAAERR